MRQHWKTGIPIGIGISLFFLLCPIPIGHFHLVSIGFHWKTNYFPIELEIIFQWNPIIFQWNLAFSNNFPIRISNGFH
jgi:hypothetical protein